MKFCWLLVACAATVSQAFTVLPYSLEFGDKAQLSWNFNDKANVIVFCLTFSRLSTVAGFGFSKDGGPQEADLVLFYLSDSNKAISSDFYTNKKGELHRKTIKKNYRLVSAKEVSVEGLLRWQVTFSRPIRIPKDSKSYQIDRGTSHLLFFQSYLIWDKLSDYKLFHSMAQLIKSQIPVPRMPSDTEKLEVRVQGVEIPDVPTTYWCKTVQLPLLKQKHHILGYEGVISDAGRGIIHHLEVFLCTDEPADDVKNFNGPCNSESKPMGLTSCRKVIGAWAMGATGVFFPKEAGFPIGGDDMTSRYAVIEIHYNNAERKSGLVDDSGLAFYLTRELRRYDVGIMELGLDYLPNNVVPPRQDHFDMIGYCLPKCTAVALPKNGIKIFASQLHTHMSGIEVKTEHFRQGEKLCDLNKDVHYSPHFQEIRMLPRAVRVLPGDALVTSCTFRTLDRANVTFGGIAISNEMCLNYVFYYPKTDLELCKSVLDPRTLNQFFKYINKAYGAQTSESKSIIQNYEAIKWGESQLQDLKVLYREGRIHQSCNTSAGHQFPGHNWENLTPDLGGFGLNLIN